MSLIKMIRPSVGTLPSQRVRGLTDLFPVFENKMLSLFQNYFCSLERRTSGETIRYRTFSLEMGT